MWDLSIFASADAWIALLTLTLMELVLGIDNIVFLSILTDRLEPEQQKKARFIGLSAALILRIALLFAISWIMGLKEPLFTILGQELSGRDLILGIGGLFLIGKSTHEIYEKLEIDEEAVMERRARAAFIAVLIQIMALDLVFSLDSVITAIGMADHIMIMVIAMVVAVGAMMVFAGRVSDFVNRHPSMKVLALAFLLLIGVMLVAESFDQHIDKGYIYFAMAFALGVELVNMRVRKARAKSKPQVQAEAP